MQEEIKHKSNSYFTIPLYFILLLWIIKWVEYKFGIDASSLGVKPQTLSGLKGIIFSPMIHADTVHLANNTVPLFILSMALFYFYKPIKWRVIIISWLVSGILTWLIGRGNSYHIGASGLIYALASFLFFSGFIRKYPRLIAISLIVTFLYGSMVWGIFPNEVRISWEGHLSGGIIGLLLAIVFRKIGPTRKIYQWEDMEDHELTEDDIILEEIALRAGEEDNIQKEQVEDLEDKLGSEPINYIYIFKQKKGD